MSPTRHLSEFEIILIGSLFGMGAILEMRSENALITKEDLEGLVVKRKDGKYSQRRLWYKILNPAYTQKTGRHEFFQRQ